MNVCCCYQSIKKTNANSNVFGEVQPQTISTCFYCHLTPTPYSEIKQVAGNDSYGEDEVNKHNKGKATYLIIFLPFRIYYARRTHNFFYATFIVEIDFLLWHKMYAIKRLLT